MQPKRWMGWFVLCASVFVGPVVSARGGDDDDEPAAEMAAPMAPAPKAAMRMDATMGATPGGAKDIEYARDRIFAGEVPHTSTFTAEGLLSQHDLPIPTSRRCTQILCLSGAAT